VGHGFKLGFRAIPAALASTKRPELTSGYRPAPQKNLSLLDPRFWLLAPFFNFSVEKRALPGIVPTPLWRRKLGLKGINGS
jgi:hypothetical protein